MTNEESLPTYTIGDTVRLPLEVRDESGIAECYANFYRMIDSNKAEPEDEEALDYDTFVHFEGDGEAVTSGIVELTAELTHEPPGVLVCLDPGQRHGWKHAKSGKSWH